jgi:hypothetical protein
MRGLKRKDTSILTGYQIYHNYKESIKAWIIKLLLRYQGLRLREIING